MSLHHATNRMAFLALIQVSKVIDERAKRFRRSYEVMERELFLPD
jgi:hypothetical protein